MWWAVLLTFALSPLFAPPVFANPYPDAREVLRKALVRANWYQEEGIESRIECLQLRISDTLDSAGEVEEREELLYEVVPLDEFEGHAFERLIRKNGRELSAKESRQEKEREQSYLSDLQKGKDPDRGRRQRVVFNEKLVGRFDFTVEGIESINDRPSYLVSFRPREGKLPEETRFDLALNRSQGKLWIDLETFEIAKVHFQLMEKIGIWWGFIGSISELEGTVERADLGNGIWMPERLDFYLNGRIFFSALHRREQITWSDFRTEELRLRTHSSPKGDTVAEVDRGRPFSSDSEAGGQP